MRKIPFSPPDISEAEIAEVAEAMRSGWITTGPRVKELEKRLAAYCHKLVEMNMGFQSLVGSQSFFGSFRSGKLKLNKRDVIRQVFRPA